MTRDAHSLWGTWASMSGQFARATSDAPKVARNRKQEGIRVQFTNWTRPLHAVQTSLLRLDTAVLTQDAVALIVLSVRLKTKGMARIPGTSARAESGTCMIGHITPDAKHAGKRSAGNPPAPLCVQLRLACLAGVSPAGVEIRSPVAWIAVRRETK